MARTAARRERPLAHVAHLVLLVSAAVLLAAAPAAEASRHLPATLAPAQAPPPQLGDLDQVGVAGDAADQSFALLTGNDLSLLAALALLDPSEVERLNTDNRLRLLADPGALPRPVALALTRKLASGPSTCWVEANIRGTGGLAQDCSGPSFQGLWTDPLTGLSYARNRWYDARTASWLSEDPLGAVDSPNLHAAFGWAPQAYTDPYGYWTWDPAEGYRWVRSQVVEAKEFYSSSDSVTLDALGNTLSDLGGGIGSVLNIGTNTGETYVEEGGFSSGESTALILAAGGGDLGEAILAGVGAGGTVVKTAQTARQVQQLRRINREFRAASNAEQTGELLSQRALVRRGFNVGPSVKIRGKKGQGRGNQGVDLVVERKNVISPNRTAAVEVKSQNFPELRTDTRGIQQATDEFNRTRLDRAANPKLSSAKTVTEAERIQDIREAGKMESYKAVYDAESGSVKFFRVVSDEATGMTVVEEVPANLVFPGF